jgi:hypothetical protein
MSEPTTDQLRVAVAMAVENTSLRSVAGKIGVTPTGLKGFLRGGEPYSPSRRRMIRWYRDREASGALSAAPGPEVVAGAVSLLVREFEADLPPHEASAIRAQIGEALSRAWAEKRGASWRSRRR